MVGRIPNEDRSRRVEDASSEQREVKRDVMAVKNLKNYKISVELEKKGNYEIKCVHIKI